MQGLFGSLFGIIAGPIGIRLSHLNQVHQMKCFWNAFIILVGYQIDLNYLNIYTHLNEFP